MSNQVEFNQYRRPDDFGDDKSFAKKMARFIIKFSGGLVKDEQQANNVILGIVAFLFLITIYQIYRGFFRSI